MGDQWYNQTLCKVNHSVIRLGVMQGEYHWHKHDNDDERYVADPAKGRLMDENIRRLGEALGTKALAKDWAGIHALLAPWLRKSTIPDQVRAFFEDEYRSLLQESGIEGMHYPEYPEPQVDGNNFMTATQLREPISFAGNKVRDVAPEVTDANVRYWLSIQLQCSDEQMEKLGFDRFCEVWVSVVEIGEGLRVGYWSQGAY